MNLTRNVSNRSVSVIFETTKCSLDILNDRVEDIQSFNIISIALSVTHTIIALTSILTNGLVITGILGTPSLHSPSNVLLCCLAITDFLAGAVTGSALIALHISRALENYKIFCTSHLTTFLTAYFLSGVSFLTLTAVSLDRLLALKLHLRYRAIVTIPRIITLEAGISIITGIFMVTPFLPHFTDFELIVGTVMVFGLIVNLPTYITIFKIVQRHRCAIKVLNDQSRRFHGQGDKEFSKLKRSSLTMAAVFVVFLICYIPHTCVSFAYYVSESRTMGTKLRLTYDLSVVLVLLNSTLNPLLYCFRIKEIQQAVHRVIQKGISTLRANL